ncbi:hypothetical protein JXR93_13190 [bacterium]|nr:hypothetical protein [bacterium]
MIDESILKLVVIFFLIFSLNLSGNNTLKTGFILGDGYGVSLNYSPQERFSIETNFKTYKYLKSKSNEQNDLDWGNFADIGLLFKQKLSDFPNTYLSTGVFYYRDNKGSWSAGMEIPLRIGVLFTDLPIELYTDVMSLYNFDKKNYDFDFRVGIRWSFGEEKIEKIPEYSKFKNENQQKNRKNNNTKRVVEKKDDKIKKESNDSTKTVDNSNQQKSTKRKIKRKVLKKDLISSDKTIDSKDPQNNTTDEDKIDINQIQSTIHYGAKHTENKQENEIKKSNSSEKIIHDPLKIKLIKEKKNSDSINENSKESNQKIPNDDEWIEVEIEVDESELNEKDKNNPKGVDVIW